MKPAKLLAAAMTAGLVALAAPAFASDPSDYATHDQQSQSDFDRLVELNPGIDPAELALDLRANAEDQGLTVAAMTSALLAEAESSAASAATSNPGGAVGYLQKSSGGSGSVPIGNAERKGDVYFSPASTLFVQHGHTGIYYSKTTTVEAPGSGKSSDSFVATSRWVSKGAVKQYVNTSKANRDKAGDFAYKHLRGHSYNSNFAFNKSTNTAPSAKYNCSQLVWLAYKTGSGIDLDSDGGNGVYPANIRDSKWTITYATVK